MSNFHKTLSEKIFGDIFSKNEKHLYEIKIFRQNNVKQLDIFVMTLISIRQEVPSTSTISGISSILAIYLAPLPPRARQQIDFKPQKFDIKNFKATLRDTTYA